MNRSGYVRVAVVTVAAVVAAMLGGCDTSPVVLRGQVALDTGGPAAGLEITAFDSGTEVAVATTVVGTNGWFTFRSGSLPDGSYRLRLGGSAWWRDAGSWTEAETVIASASAPPSIHATVPASRVVGRITGGHGSGGVGGAVVEVLRTDGRAVVAATVAAADGTYAVDVPDGTFLVRAEAPGFATTYRGDVTTPTGATPVTVGAGEQVGAHIVLSPASVLSGTLLDDAPLAGAWVVAIGADGGGQGSAVTDHEGRFAISGLAPGGYRLLIVSNGAGIVVGPHWTGDIGSLEIAQPDCSHPLAVPGADLTGADLSGADLSGCDLSGADLSGADLTEADLSHADLSDADLSFVDLSGAVLRHATLTGARSRGITGDPVDLPRPWMSRGGALFGPGAVVTSTGLGGIDLAGADLSGAVLAYSNLSGADLRGANLAGANLGGTWLMDADLTGADLTGADLWALYAAGADLSGADLRRAHVTDADLAEVRLDGVTSGGMTGAAHALPAGWRVASGHLVGAGARLVGADLSGADLSNLDLSRADLSDADLSAADLTGAGLLHTDLTRTDLSGAVLTGVASGGILGNPAALPPPWVLVRGALLGPGANLPWASLNGADLSGLDLSGVNFDDADLAGSDLRGTNLTGASLRRTNLTGTDLTGADLTRVRSRTIVGVPASVSLPWAFRNGALVGPTVDIERVDLSDADLSGLDLTGANLTRAFMDRTNIAGTDLTGATLVELVSRNLSGVPEALPGSWVLVSGHLIGPTAQVLNADLSGVDLSALDLTEVNFGGTDLSGASLAGTKLTGATMYRTNLGGADLTGADLGYADLTVANLDLAFLTQADLTGASLYYAGMNFVTAPGATFDGADLREARMVSANLAGAGFRGSDLQRAALGFANLMTADLTDADLTGVDLTSGSLHFATMQGTLLSNAKLDGVQSSGIVGTPASLPQGWALIAGSLVRLL